MSYSSANVQAGDWAGAERSQGQSQLRIETGLGSVLLRLALGAFCTSPVSSLYTEANEAPLEERRWRLPCITMWKLVPALTIQHIMPCINSTEPLEIYMLPGQMEEEAWPDPRPPHWSQSRGSHDLCRDQCRIGLPPEDTQLSTRNAWLWSQETRPHWSSK